MYATITAELPDISTHTLRKEGDRSCPTSMIKNEEISTHTLRKEGD